MTRFIWLLTTALVLSACTSSPAPTPSNPTPQPLVLDTFAANPNPSPINLGVQFSWSVLGGGNKTCKLDVNNDGTFEYTLNGCDSSSKQAHTYNAVGTYTAKLVVSDASTTLEKTASLSIIAENKKPNVVELIAQQTANPLRVRWVFKVSDAEGDVLTCKLDVNNDGEPEFVFTPCNSNAVNSINTSNALNSSSLAVNAANKTPANNGGAVEHTYPAKGTYTARLEVSDLYNSVSSTRSVTVPVNPEVLEFAANPSQVVANQDTTFAFKVNSPNGLALKCILTTGDDNTFTFDPCPSNVQLKQAFVYLNVGKYTATLTVQDSLGNSTVRNLSLNIAPIRFTQIAGGVSHTCALANNQKSYCWGLNNAGQLGNSNNTDANTPQLVTLPSGVTFSQISAGFVHTCALSTTGQAYCWGLNNFGQLGNSNNTDANTPQLVTLPTGVTLSQISAGGRYTCALSTTGQAYCWGRNNFGQLGNGNTISFNTPQLVTMPSGITFTQISAGGDHTCALGSNNHAYCWGLNNFGQLGNGNNTNASTPQPVTMPTGVTFSQITSGNDHTCALGSNNQAYCWGGNLYGQLGNSNNTDANTPQLVTMPIGVTFSRISAGLEYTCALGSNNQAYCWGRNFFGQLGNGNNTNANIPQAVLAGEVPTGVTFSQISTGLQHTCTLGSNNQAYCWGQNGVGQLGNGNTINANIPQAVVMP